ncbi:DNA-directed RNA polymerase subunit alpha [Candidatus Falkowbacteria bacterium]|uniref:DNA-directed RNA polymerase subunit alpha n=1 Tax=Candidatus Falkowbacteria bacterium CG10_big_fil_rev_8_21_14_0_10_37_18 TaxID=1974562 RepID=A0A2H0V8X1_9BACT|nr:DNA-directed RNA polymerase subunit alpha [Candidatus Falkowbacteria bacterium]NCQ12560.1 DNA-directed RNA polymerase subunit alpha [Candidatus Falkowbacteria bacterium]OIO06022.1 MAG: DNA-directed RNA polymerase subunit alpha [Candidatus Falkowbacteria bacterium CG1_02_37_21]PIR95546.1 MAG: DNA-directed RNA polymerase subunit alpha [Candidatus Falkowbacteria bacterium CG10_big_fil_rev_8_21_14_0_10_37_18]
MQNIALPKKIEFTNGANAQEGVVTVEPLFPGYGMTLGNSLRRVLLSSLPGAAVVGVKIKGASHEFMALPHVKEDVLEIVLNLKQLRLKIHTEDEVRLDLKLKGKKVVTAGDIAKNTQAEVKNPDLVLAHITDEAGSLEMEIVVHEGRGYRMAEGTKRENREIGYIELDSIYSPVTLVSIDVENTRVGKMTNWDKLVLNIKTDGTISPEEAFNKAVEILVNQYSSLLPNYQVAELVEADEKTEEVVVEDEEIEEEADKDEVVEKKAKAPKKDKVKKTKK